MSAINTVVVLAILKGCGRFHRTMRVMIIKRNIATTTRGRSLSLAHGSGYKKLHKNLLQTLAKRYASTN